MRGLAAVAATGALTLTGALLVAPAAGAATTSAAPSVTSAASTIYACQKKKGGTIRIVKSKTKCKSNEKKISWNVTGPQGAAGANGANGSNGAAGANGAPGPGATPFNGSASQDSVGGATTMTTVSIGPSTLTFRCSAFLGAGSQSIQLASTVAGNSVTRGIWTDDANDPGLPGRDYQQDTFNAGASNVAIAGGPNVLFTNPTVIVGANAASYQVVLTLGSETFLVSYWAVTGYDEAPATDQVECQVSGWWARLA